jgi:hypothetical protein
LPCFIDFVLKTILKKCFIDLSHEFQNTRPARMRPTFRAAVSNRKKAFATNVATGASLSPHFLAILCGKDFLKSFFHYD